ncbi:hypothetical protein PENSPDRAFT_654556 [Peniophora sp. CONT]|nr:hypothetical protein PENSPDRAFT_654556 [Peniophora sp. CONT]
MSLPNQINTIGSLAIGWGLSCLVLGIVGTQAWTYYARYPSDSWTYKLLVASLVALQLLHQALVGHTVWFYSVANFGNNATYFMPPVWSLSVQVVLGAFVGAIVKTCYGMRVWRFSQGNYVVTGLIMAMTAAQLATAFAFTVRSFNVTLINSQTIKNIGLASLALGAVTDIFTAASLSYFLHHMKTGYLRSDTLIRQLIVHTVNTGLLTSLFSFAVLILYNSLPRNFVFMSVYFILVKLYAVSCLATLNSRRFVSGRGTDNDAHHASPEEGLALPSLSKKQSLRAAHAQLEVGVHQEVSIVTEQSEARTIHTVSSHGKVPYIPYTTGW